MSLNNGKWTYIKTTKIKLKRGEAAVKSKNYGGTRVTETNERLVKIIDLLNQNFGIKFTDEDCVIIEHREEKPDWDPQAQSRQSAGHLKRSRRTCLMSPSTRTSNFTKRLWMSGRFQKNSSPVGSSGTLPPRNVTKSERV